MIHFIFIIIIWILNHLILILRFFILISFHPIFIGILILLLCLLVRVTISCITFSWLSFLLFYLIRGGILILLLYISCFRFNPIFKNSSIILLIVIILSLFIIKKHSFVFKNFFTNLLMIETGGNLGNFLNISFLTLASFFIFICFFNIRKIITSVSFSIRKFYLRRHARTANSCKYLKYLLI